MSLTLLLPFLTAAIPPTAVQQPAEIVLTAVARLETEGFTRIRGVRELPDGRVLVADQTENALYLVDFRTGARTKLGGNGPGPEEYDGPTGLYPFRGDSSVLTDSRNQRLSILDGAGRIIYSEPMFRPNMSIPSQVDARGNMYWDLVTTVRLAKRTDPSADQAGIGRFERTTGAIDTVGYLTIPGPINPNAFPAWDEWAVALDGRVVIARNQDEYRIDWVLPDGQTIRGTPVRSEPLRVTDDDRERFRAGPGGGRASGVSMGGRASRPPSLLDIPDRFPPVKQRGVWVAYDGRAFIERHQHLSETRPLLDVFDASGQLVARYRLPENRRVVGFGQRGLYAVRVDESDLLWLELYGLTAPGG
jgi:hypothetical protein